MRSDMVAAMKAKDELRLTVLRGLLTLVTQELTATKRTPRDTLSDDDMLALMRRALKQRREAAAQFRTGGRDDLAEREDAEASVLESYLPAQLSEDEVRAVVLRLKEEHGITDKTAAGKLTGAVMSELKGRAEGTLVRTLVLEALA